METYFRIDVSYTSWSRDEDPMADSFGPYTNYEEALKIMLEWIPSRPHRWPRIRIVEFCYAEGQSIDIDTKIEEVNDT